MYGNSGGGGGVGSGGRRGVVARSSGMSFDRKSNHTLSSSIVMIGLPALRPLLRLVLIAASVATSGSSTKQAYFFARSH